MKAYFIGGGVGSLAEAAFLVRDGAVAKDNITIYDGTPLLGWSLDGAQLPDGSSSLRGGRMLTTDQLRMHMGSSFEHSFLGASWTNGARRNRCVSAKQSLFASPSCRLQPLQG